MGNSWGLILPKALLEVMDINPVIHEVSITVENDEIKLKKYKENEE